MTEEQKDPYTETKLRLHRIGIKNPADIIVHLAAAVEREYALELGISNKTEIVRCQDCKHRDTDKCAMWIECSCCGSQADWCKDNDYCSWGERKDTK